MNEQIVNEFIKAAKRAAPPEVVMKMSIEDSTQTGHERVDYEFAHKSQNGWKVGVDRELALRIYDRLCHCRDMEIELVWKRAVFMTAFLIACFAGYGGLIVAGLSRTYSARAFFFVTTSACFLATIGFSVSLLWIMMCKGSKAWYEHYEDAIKAYAQKVFEDEYATLFAHNWKCLAEVKSSKIPNRFWTTQGGPYSVSRLAIVIGHLSAIIWAAIIVGHGVVLGHVLRPVLKREVWTFNSIMATGTWVLAVICMIIVVECSRRIAKSGYLGGVQKDEDGKKQGEKNS